MNGNKMSETKLKRCPCCTGKVKIITFHNILEDADIAYIQCQECKLQTKEVVTSIRFGDDLPILNPIECLIKSWNTRKPMRNIVERLEKIKEKSITPANILAHIDFVEGLNKAIQIVKEEGGINE